MTNEEIEKLKKDYVDLKKSYENITKKTNNLYNFNKSELIKLLRYEKYKNKKLEDKILMLKKDWIHKDDFKNRINKIDFIITEFKENVKKAKNKKEIDYWEQQIIALIEQKKVLNYFIN